LFERLLDRVIEKAPVSIPSYNINPLGPPVVKWGVLADACCPAAGGLDPLRAKRKEQQVENLVGACCALIDHLIQTTHRHKTVHVIEFCGGAGYVGLPLAALYAQRRIDGVDGDVLCRPAVVVTILDMKEQSLEIASARIEAAGLQDIVKVKSQHVLFLISQASCFWFEPF
jgi:predicted O-methyltransferase YrrM